MLNDVLWIGVSVKMSVMFIADEDQTEVETQVIVSICNVVKTKNNKFLGVVFSNAPKRELVG